MKRARTAFTLVELLVVIGIIALLISILMPALSKAKAQAMRISCASNLRAQGQGLAVYIHDTKYYPGHMNERGGTRYAVWPTRIRKALRGGRGIFWCPANEPGFQWQSTSAVTGVASAIDTDQGFGYNTGEMLLNVFLVPFSYGYNDWGSINVSNPQLGLGGDVWIAGFNELKAAKVKKPSEMIAITDNTSDGVYDYAIDPRNPAEAPGKIHSNGANVLFCDGHVQWFAQKELTNVDPSRPGGAAMNRMWNNDNQVHW